MSTIAAKKAQQRKAGAEIIMYWMGGIFFLALLLEIVLYWILKYDINPTSLVPIYYFLFMGGITIGIGSFIQVNPDKQNVALKDWFVIIVICSVLFGMDFGSYMW